LVADRNGGGAGTVTREGYEGEDGGRGAPPPTSGSFQKEPLVFRGDFARRHLYGSLEGQ